MECIFEQISEKLQKGDMKSIRELTQQSLDEGNGISDTLDALLKGMSILGDKFKKNQIFVPEVLMAARAMNSGLNILKPLMKAEGVEPKGKVILGTVKGDLHDIGKNLVKMMMIGAGLEVIDLGVDVSKEQFIDAIEKENADIIAMSALLTTTMPYMKEVVKALEKRGIRNKVKIMIGGAPVTDKYRELIGADRYTPDAASAAEEAKNLILT